MYNLMGNIPMVKSAGIMGANFGADKVPLVHTYDIAAVAAEELLTLSFKGFTIRYIGSDEKNRCGDCRNTERRGEYFCSLGGVFRRTGGGRNEGWRITR
jgi:hypothetical protein